MVIYSPNPQIHALNAYLYLSSNSYVIGINGYQCDHVYYLHWIPLFIIFCESDLKQKKGNGDGDGTYLETSKGGLEAWKRAWGFFMAIKID